MTTKTFETKQEAKDHCLALCRELCKPDREICNPTRSEAKEYWRNCLNLRLSFCQHYSYRQVPGLRKKVSLSYCNKPQALTGFCLGKGCKDLPVIVIAEEQTAAPLLSQAPELRDGKMAAAND